MADTNNFDFEALKNAFEDGKILYANDLDTLVGYLERVENSRIKKIDGCEIDESGNVNLISSGIADPTDDITSKYYFKHN